MAPVAISAPGGIDVSPNTLLKARSAPVTAMPTPPTTAAVPTPQHSDALTPTPTDPYPTPVDSVVKPAVAKAKINLDIPARRPSPWHDLAHSLSTTALAHRRSFTAASTPSTASTPPINTRNGRDHSAGGPSPGPSPPLSTSQALREWETRLSQPSSSYSRHTLIPPPTPHTPSPELNPIAGAGAGMALVPKLVPESDKHGHIEYKLKLINPSGERFERLVTQMMWRLKQGRNEAIYELGLADDGTVVGLSRSDMDASLRTLELMASEVGATVLVLKEIVLAKSVLDLARGEALSPSRNASWSSRDESPAGWVVPRKTSWAAPVPKLDSDGAASAGSQGEDDSIDWHKEKKKAKKIKKKKSWRRRERRGLWGTEDTDGSGVTSKERQIVFNLPAGSEGESSDDEEDIIEVSEERRTRTVPPPSAKDTKDRNDHPYDARSDDDVSPFHLDLEDMPPRAPPTGQKWSSRRSRSKAKACARALHPNELPPHEKARKTSAKVRKAIERREERRLSLLRGDGMTPSPFDLLEDVSDVHTHGSGVSPHAPGASPHAPSRPSSLRLTAPAYDTVSAASTIDQHVDEAEVEEEESAIIQDLLSLPLDSLSLSFADVRTVAASPPLSPSSSSSTEYAPTMHAGVALDGDEVESNADDEGEERICVEALVVRKVLHEEDEDAWGWGGDDDGWGLSADRDEANEPVEREDAVVVQGMSANVQREAQWVPPAHADEVDDGDDPWGFG